MKDTNLVDVLLPPTSKVCEVYVFTPVCQSFCSQGSTWAGTHPGQVLPLGRYPLSRYTLSGKVHHPWESTFPRVGTPPLGRYRPGKYNPPAGTPPGQVQPQAGTSPQNSAIGHAGRYGPNGCCACCWNAFLLIVFLLLFLSLKTFTFLIYQFTMRKFNLYCRDYIFNQEFLTVHFL